MGLFYLYLYLYIITSVLQKLHGSDTRKHVVLNSEMEEEDTEKTGPHKEPTDPDFQSPAFESPHKFTQNELNDLSTRFGAAKGKGRTAINQNETMEIFI